MRTVFGIGLVLAAVCLYGATASIIDTVFGSGPDHIQRSKPSFCKDHQCPNFTIVEQYPEYEVRRYEPTTWVSTRSSGGWFERTRMFRRLAKYTLKGDNNMGLRMQMTVPVLSKYVGSDLVEMFFMLPEANQRNPPTPNDQDVTIVRMPAMEVYVRAFGGMSFGYRYNGALTELKAALGPTERYEQGFMYRVGYDSPWTLRDRHNEVWLVKN